MLWKLLPQIAASLVAALVIGLDYYWHDKRTRKFRIWRSVLLWLILLLAVTTIVATYIDEKEKAAQDKKLNEIVSRQSRKPRFNIFVARAPGATKIQLTNNSILFVPINFASDAPAQHFVINNPGTTPQQIDLPIPSGSNSVPLYFAIQNVGESTANGTQFTFACDPALKVQSDKGWTTIVREQQGTAPLPKVMGINLTAPLHQLDGNILPKIEFTPETNLLSPEALAFQSDGTNWQVSIRTVPPSPIQIPMEVEIKAEGADPTLLTFSAIFYLSNASKDPELASQPDTNTFLMIDPWNISGIHPAKTNLQN